MASEAVGTALRAMENFSSLVLREIRLEKEVEQDRVRLESWLQTLRAFLSDREGTRGNQLRQDEVSQIRNFAFEIADIFDEFVFQERHHVHTHILRKITHELLMLPQNNFGDLQYLRAENTSCGEGKSSSAWSEDHLARRVIEEDDIVGFEGDAECICDQLLSGDPGLLTVFIVGPCGSGKTVLANKVFKCKRVQGHFDVRAWVDVSPSLKLDELLRSILTQFFPEMDGSVPINEFSVREISSAYLWQKRFIVGLDYIGRMGDCELIIKELLKTSQGGRILVTSRNREVSMSCVQYPIYVHELNGLSRENAFTLFCKWAFRSCNGICPSELLDLSNKIIDKCDRLPSALIEAGIFLSKKQQTPLEWNKWHNSLGANLHFVRSILLPSKHLPSNQRSCFLYFSILPEGYSIQRARLIRLWAAEGFVEESRNTTLEEIVENYLNELIRMNLVHVTEREIDGRVRSCRVLNLVHECITATAEKENFVGSASERSSSSQGRIQLRRLSIQMDNRASVALGKTLGHVRSAFMFGRVNILDLKFFRLLKVLDIQGAPLEDFPDDIVKLVLLKYLSLRETNIKTVPDSIKKLTLLETLDLKQTRVTQLPRSIFQLHRLRHLLVYRYDVKSYVNFDSAKGVEMHSGSGALSSMQKLMLIEATPELIKKVDGMINLRKLGLVNLKSKDGRKVCESIQKMKHLSTLYLRAELGDYLELDHIQIKPGFEFLQRLYLGGQLQKVPTWVSSLQSLIKVGLRWSRLNINPLQALQHLPNLIQLHMVDSFMGQTLEFKANTFKKLKILSIEQFSELRMVVVQVNAMPALETLTFCKCEKLNMLPLGMNMLSFLQKLVLYDMDREFIYQLRKNSEDRNLVSHIRAIHSYTLGHDQSWVFENLS
ncbi:hypothetical protein BT93_D0850 [Corymbia citriodora subsp. variegata]|nr:hypothetical protein BT93_D0850 [Corymbia citriodora subsp. variegata]